MPKRTERIDLRVTPEEKEQIKQAALTAGLTVTGLLMAKIGELAGDMIGKAIIDRRAKE